MQYVARKIRMVQKKIIIYKFTMPELHKAYMSINNSYMYVCTANNIQ